MPCWIESVKTGQTPPARIATQSSAFKVNELDAFEYYSFSKKEVMPDA